jgi:hypothetical protein
MFKDFPFISYVHDTTVFFFFFVLLISTYQGESLATMMSSLPGQACRLEGAPDQSHQEYQLNAIKHKNGCTKKKKAKSPTDSIPT